MKTPVHMLITVRKPELLPVALLAFKTLRTAFPTSPVYVWGNGLPLFLIDQVQKVCMSVRATFKNLQPTCHDMWIQRLVMNEESPFWICDGDMVFFEEMERCFAGDGQHLFAGRYEPTWDEPWTNSIHVERLHTSLMWFNPNRLRAAMAGWLHQTVPQVFANADMTLIRQHFIPARGGRPQFYDTTAGLWHAGGGTKFTERQNRSFEHLHCGSYSDEVSKVECLKGLPAAHAAIIANPALARGIQDAQNQFYATRAVKPLTVIKKRKKKL